MKNKKRFHLEQTDTGYVIVSNYTGAKKYINAINSIHANSMLRYEEKNYHNPNPVTRQGSFKETKSNINTAEGRELYKYTDKYSGIITCKPRVSF